MTLGGASSGAFYSNSGCTVTASNLVINSGSNLGTIYFKGAMAENVVLTGAATGLSTALFSLSSGTLSFPANSASQNISFNINDDIVSEANETIIVTLSSLTNAVIGATSVATITIVDNDSPRAPTSIVQDTVISVLGTNWDEMAIGYSTICGLRSGVVYCWGDNQYGQLGDGTTVSRETSARVADLSSSVTAIATENSGNNSQNHFCALDSGTVKCWGYNGYGQIGDSSTTDRSSPVQVTGATSGVTAIGLGDYATVAIHKHALSSRVRLDAGDIMDMD